MTLLGKFFSVAILLFSLAFMLLALVINASHRNWRDVVLDPGGMKDQIEDMADVNDQLRDSAKRLQADLDREKVARATALAKLQTKLTLLQERLTESVNAVTDLRGKTDQLSRSNLSRAEELDQLTDETTRLRAAIRSEQGNRDEIFAETLALTDKMSTLRSVVQIQQERNDQLMTQVTRYKEVVDANGIDLEDSLDGAPPKRNGVVLVINRPKKLVQVSIGYDEGLRPGHLLEVSRDGRFVTKLEVINTDPDNSVAQIKTDFSEGIIREGDRVDTTF